MQIKLAIADDQSIFRTGVIASLARFEDIQFVIDAAGGRELLSQIPEHQPQVVLLDMRMPDMNGIDVCKHLKSTYPSIQIIGLSVYDNHHYISSFFEAGGSGYLLKDVDPEEIYKAIRTVVEQGAYLSDHTSVKLIQKLMDLNHPSVYYNVSDAVPLKEIEIAILRLIAQEYTIAEIADKLNLGIKSVERYRSILIDKIGAKNMAGLITYAIKKGIVMI